MSRIFYEMKQAAERLGVDVSEVESMVELRELTLVQVGSRRLVHVRDVEEILSRVERGGPLRTRREYHGAMLPEAVREAAAHLGIAEKDLIYEVLDRPQLRMPGIEGRPARIAVELPQGAKGIPEDPQTKPDEPADEPTDETTEDEMIRHSGNVSLYEILRKASASEPPGSADVANGDPVEREEPAEREDPVEETVQVPAVSEDVEMFYAPEQVARLLGRKTSDVNLWIYRRDLPTVNINDYLWVPEEAVLELLKKEPPLGTGIPPKPFRLVVPPDDPATGSIVFRLGDGEVAESETREALRRRVTELERLVEELREQIPRDEPSAQADVLVGEAPLQNGLDSPGPVADVG